MGSNLTLHKYTNRFYEIHQTKNEEKPASGQSKVRADIFSGSLAVCLFASASRRGRRKGGLGGIPPASPIVRNFGSDIFKQTPPVGKRRVWLARYAGSPADFRREIEFLFLFREAKR